MRRERSRFILIENQTFVERFSFVTYVFVRCKFIVHKLGVKTLSIHGNKFPASDTAAMSTVDYHTTLNQLGKKLGQLNKNLICSVVASDADVLERSAQNCYV